MLTFILFAHPCIFLSQWLVGDLTYQLIKPERLLTAQGD